jgi:hypothetical protein
MNDKTHVQATIPAGLGLSSGITSPRSNEDGSALGCDELMAPKAFVVTISCINIPRVRSLAHYFLH